MSLIGVLSSSRATVGAGAWLAPGLAGRVLGLGALPAAERHFVVRLFAIRDLALAAGLLLSSGRSRRLWLQMGILCDGADGLAGILAGRENKTAMLLSAPALVGVGLGVAEMRVAP